jgi:acyl carrier protein
MVPSAFVALPALPLTGNGKVDRGALPDADLIAPIVVTTPPRNDIETVLASVWGEVLGLPTLDVETSFFELGGHSLLATRIAVQVSKIFRVTLPLRRFFETPTVAGVARVVEALEGKPGQTAQIARLFLKAQRMTPEEREHLRRDKARPAPTGTP